MAEQQFAPEGIPSFSTVQSQVEGGMPVSPPAPLNIPSHVVPAQSGTHQYAPAPQYQQPQPPPQQPQQPFPGTAPTQPQPSPASGPAVPPATPASPTFASQSSFLQQTVPQPGPAPGQAPPQAPAGQPPQPGPMGQQQVPQPPGMPVGGDETSPFRDALAQSGFNLAPFGDAPDQDILTYLVNQHRVAAHEVPQLRELANLGRQVSNDWEGWREYQQTRQARGGQQPPAAPGVPAAQAAPKPATDWWPAPPELNPVDKAIIASYNRGEIAKEAVPAETIARVQARAQWEQDRQEKLLANPVDTLLPGFLPKLDERFATKTDIQLAIKEMMNEQFVNSWAAANEGLFYQKDPATGQYAVDPMTGQRQMSPYGQQYGQTIQLLEHFDPTSPVAVAQLAQMIVGPPPQQQVALPPSPNGNGHPSGQLQTFAPQPVPQPAPVPTPQQSFVAAAQQAQQMYPGYPPDQRGGFVGQPSIGLGPQSLALPSLSEVSTELHGRSW